MKHAPKDSSTAAADSILNSVSVVMPVFNQMDYTRGCVNGLQNDVSKGLEVIIINNGSSDGTAEYLATLSGMHVVNNPVNLGCAAGWNQGVKAASREWIIVLNNDVVLAKEWIEALVAYATARSFHIVTPAIREGPLNYDFPAYAADFTLRMKDVHRPGVANGICFMVHRRVFETAGMFDEKFRIGQFEDADFFLRARRAGFKLGTTGSAFLHHFGSITQIAIRKTPVANAYEAENRAYFRNKWGLTAPKRQWQRWQRQSRSLFWRISERLRHGHTLEEKWIKGKLRFY